jgi:hypothetical protein
LLSKNLKINIYVTIILTVVLFECEGWSLTLTEERRLRVFLNRVLRRILGLKRVKCCSGGQIEKNEIGGACSMYWERRGIYRVFVGKPEGKRVLGRPRHRWKDSLKMDLQELGSGGMEWIELAQDGDGGGHL